MSAEVETMFSLREKPWHGLGNIIQDAPTSEEALRLAGLDWTVNPMPVFCEGKEIPNTQANVRSSDHSVLGITTEKYAIVQNKDAFAFVDQILSTGNNTVKFETAGSLFNGKKVWMLAQMPKEVLMGDDYLPYLCFTNSHDGKGAVRVMVTLVRVVCNNTLNLAVRESKRAWSVKHMGLDIKDRLMEATRALDLYNKYMDSFKAEASTLANKKLSTKQFDDFLTKLFPLADDATDRMKNNVQKQKETLSSIYNFTPDLSNFRGSAYGVIQAVSQFSFHSTPLRLTDTYAENRMDRALEGDKLLETAHSLLMVA